MFFVFPGLTRAQIPDVVRYDLLASKNADIGAHHRTIDATVAKEDVQKLHLQKLFAETAYDLQDVVLALSDQNFILQDVSVQLRRSQEATGDREHTSHVCVWTIETGLWLRRDIYALVL